MIKELRRLVLFPFKFVARFTNNIYETLVYFTTKQLAPPGCISRLSSSLGERRTLRILGNGKSLSDVLNIWDDRDEYEYMVVNRHVLSDSYSSIRPRFYTIADSHFYLHKEGISVLSQINVHTQWEMFLFIPYEPAAKIKMAEIISNPLIHICYYNSGTYKGFSCIKEWLYSKNLSMPISQNVLVASLYISIFLGYSDVELYGVEHSWTRFLFVNNNNEVCLENPHFFDKESAAPRTWKEIQHEDAHMHDALRKYAQMFDSYWEIKRIALRHNVHIINKTKDSFIDAFPKK